MAQAQTVEVEVKLVMPQGFRRYLQDVIEEFEASDSPEKQRIAAEGRELLARYGEESDHG